jgi:hypothetical protein
MSRSRTVVEAVPGKTSMPRNTSGVLKGERAICGSWCSGGLASGRTGVATIDIRVFRARIGALGALVLDIRHSHLGRNAKSAPLVLLNLREKVLRHRSRQP